MVPPPQPHRLWSAVPMDEEEEKVSSSKFHLCFDMDAMSALKFYYPTGAISGRESLLDLFSISFTIATDDARLLPCNKK
jgi:hypothetical protein